MKMDKNFFGLLFAVHQPGSFILNPRGFLNLQLNYIPGFGDIRFTEHREQVYRTRKRRHVGLEYNPHIDYRCVNDIFFRVEKCLDIYYQIESNCTIFGTSVLNCSSPKSLSRYIQLVNKTWISQESDFVATTKCQLPCTTEYYDVVTVREKAQRTEDDSGLIHFHLYVGTDKIINMQELLIYDNNNVIADVGGYLGLLLGVSAFSLYQKLMSYFEGIRAKVFGQNIDIAIAMPVFTTKVQKGNPFYPVEVP